MRDEVISNFMPQIAPLGQRFKQIQRVGQLQNAPPFMSGKRFFCEEIFIFHRRILEQGLSISRVNNSRNDDADLFTPVGRAFMANGCTVGERPWLDEGAPFRIGVIFFGCSCVDRETRKRRCAIATPTAGIIRVCGSYIQCRSRQRCRRASRSGSCRRSADRYTPEVSVSCQTVR